jgi:glutathione synthase/RimK-type ligase-like ATP-grasp enzyme
MDKKKIHVLVFPAGEINAVELHDALSGCVNVELFGGASVDRHGPYIFKNYISGIPFIKDEHFIDSFNKTLADHQIDVIFPTHDAVATFLIDNQESINAKVIAGDRQTSAVCRDKQKTYDLFADTDILPRIYAAADVTEFPVFAKPKVGSGSVGARKIGSAEDLKLVDPDVDIVCEYLPDEEYTVDCLTDKNGKLVVVSPRSRDRTLAGVSVSGRTQELTTEVERIAAIINDRLSFLGLWFFQIKKDANGAFKLLEISTRCAGTMCLTRVRGINLALMSVYAALGYDVEALPNPYNVTMDRTLISRYKIDYDYGLVYLDFDDTVIINGMVHLPIMHFLYQCRNSNTPVVLITKHAEVIHETLAKYCIDERLFSEIIHLDADAQKVENIKPEGAIFIDNAFQERKLVYDTYNIPVFDVDTVEVLLDWRN